MQFSPPNFRSGQFPCNSTAIIKRRSMSANKQHREYVMTRPALSDADFASRLNVSPDQQRFVVALREALSNICRVPPTAIYPEDTPESLVKLAGYWDDLPVVMYLEEVLGV